MMMPPPLYEPPLYEPARDPDAGQAPPLPRGPGPVMIPFTPARPAPAGGRSGMKPALPVQPPPPDMHTFAQMLAVGGG